MSQNGAPVEYAVKETTAIGDGKDKGEVFANSIHLSLQGKGGVGKSLVASILAQYFNARGKAVRCVDTEPVNRTLFQYKALNVNRLELLREGDLLGCVIAHELGHLLLGKSSHSEEGLMRARWEARELREAAKGNLLFSKSETERMRVRYRSATALAQGRLASFWPAGS